MAVTAHLCSFASPVCLCVKAIDPKPKINEYRWYPAESVVKPRPTDWIVKICKIPHGWVKRTINHQSYGQLRGGLSQLYVVCKPHEHWFIISAINPTLNQVMFTNLATLTIVTFTRRPALTKWTKPTYIAKWGSVVQFASYLWVPVAQSHGSFPCSSKARQEFAHGVVKVHKTFLLGTEWGYASLIYSLDEWGSTIWLVNIAMENHHF